MKKFFLVFLIIFLTHSSYAKDAAKPVAKKLVNPANTPKKLSFVWDGTPKTTTFEEFKYFANAIDVKTKKPTYMKQKFVRYQLTKMLDADKTVICYGPVKFPSGKETNVFCALKSVGSNSCDNISADNCAHDSAVMLIPMKQ